MQPDPGGFDPSWVGPTRVLARGQQMNRAFPLPLLQSAPEGETNIGELVWDYEAVEKRT